MRKLLKFFIIVGILLTIIGGGLVAYGIVTHKFVTDTVTHTHDVEDEFNNIKIDEAVSDVTFIKSTDGKNKVECIEVEKYVHDVNVKDNTLIINSVDNFKWYENIFNWSFDTYKVNVYLTETAFDNLDIKTSTGNVKVSDDFTFEDVKIVVSTGDINLYASVNNNIKIETSTGDVSVNNSDCNEIGMVTSTGCVKLKTIRCEKLKVEVSTGDVALDDVIANNSIVIDTSTGCVEFKNIDAATIDIDTSTGDITGNVLTDKSFDVDTSTGDTSYPKGTTGGLCKLRTSTGDITVTVGNK